MQYFKRTPGSAKGAGILGVHLEGPFISHEKRGAHPSQCILPITRGMDDLEATYGDLDHVAIVTLAPELENAMPVIRSLRERGITVSIGQ